MVNKLLMFHLRKRKQQKIQREKRKKKRRSLFKNKFTDRNNQLRLKLMRIR